MDKDSKKKRSEIMRAIRSRDSKMELVLRRELNKRGIRYRKNVARMVGKPDIVFLKKKLVVFLDSCFWHGCKKHCRLPTSNRKYWTKKIERNQQRDKDVNKIYQFMGWKFARFWEHDINGKKPAVTAKILRMSK